MSTTMSQEALKARREYYRQWRNANKEKMKAYQEKHFEKMAKKMQEQESQIQQTTEGIDNQ